MEQWSKLQASEKVNAVNVIRREAADQARSV